jgi:hypothetical protein
MTFDDAVNLLARDERFKATVSAMNTLLIQKGVYTQEEFESYFCQWAEASLRKSASTRPRSRSVAAGQVSV